MQVRSTSIALPSAAEYRRHPGGAAAVRAPGDVAEEAPRREVTRIRAAAPAHEAMVREVMAHEAMAYEAMAYEAMADMPARSRGALSAYLSNGPTLSERYGVELAGVDLFV